MPADAAMLHKLAALGLSAEQVAGVVAIFDEADQDRRAKSRDRSRRYRERHVTSRDGDVMQRDGDVTSRDAPPDKEKVPDLPKKTNPQFSPPTEVRTNRAREETAGFDAFWQVWPNKVGKPAAAKAWPKAVKSAGSVDRIIEGVRRYVAAKPPDRPWLNPATFLNQERWADAPATVATGPPRRRPDGLTGFAAVAADLQQDGLFGDDGNDDSGDDDRREDWGSGADVIDLEANPGAAAQRP